MSKTQELDALFEKWNDGSYDVFMKDGIVCEESYENILFLLKDVNNAKPDDINDMRIDVATSLSGGKTWFDVAIWASVLLDGTLIKDMTHDIQHQQLKRVAIMNFKKEAGGSSVTQKVIKDYAKKDRQNILDEIKICNPKLIIACSRDVFDALTKDVLEFHPKKEYAKLIFTEKMSGHGKYVDISEQLGVSTPVYVVEYRHPNQCGRQGSREDHFKNMLTIRKRFLSD